MNLLNNENSDCGYLTVVFRIEKSFEERLVAMNIIVRSRFALGNFSRQEFQTADILQSKHIENKSTRNKNSDCGNIAVETPLH